VSQPLRRCPKVFLSAIALAATVIFWLRCRNGSCVAHHHYHRPPLRSPFRIKPGGE
jgi:hypothetical protein